MLTPFNTRFAVGLAALSGLLAGANDMDLLRRTGEGRDINRHYYEAHEIEAELQRPVVRKLFELIRFRNTHDAFAGEFNLLPGGDQDICIEWRNGSQSARLEVDLKAMHGAITYSADDEEGRLVLVPGAAQEVVP